MENIKFDKPKHHCTDGGCNIFIFEDDSSGAVTAIIRTTGTCCIGTIFDQSIADEISCDLAMPESLATFTECETFKAKIVPSSAHVVKANSNRVTVKFSRLGEYTYGA